MFGTIDGAGMPPVAALSPGIPSSTGDSNAPPPQSGRHPSHSHAESSEINEGIALAGTATANAAAPAIPAANAVLASMPRSPEVVTKLTCRSFTRDSNRVALTFAGRAAQRIAAVALVGAERLFASKIPLPLGFSTRAARIPVGHAALTATWVSRTSAMILDIHTELLDLIDRGLVGDIADLATRHLGSTARHLRSRLRTRCRRSLSHFAARLLSGGAELRR